MRHEELCAEQCFQRASALLSGSTSRKPVTLSHPCFRLTRAPGRMWSCPILVAPMAMQKMAHPDGERGTMGAAAANGMGMVRIRGNRRSATALLFLLHVCMWVDPTGLCLMACKLKRAGKQA